MKLTLFLSFLLYVLSLLALLGSLCTRVISAGYFVLFPVRRNWKEIQWLTGKEMDIRYSASKKGKLCLLHDPCEIMLKTWVWILQWVCCLCVCLNKQFSDGVMIHSLSMRRSFDARKETGWLFFSPRACSVELVHDPLFLNLCYFDMVRTVKENPSDGTFERWNSCLSLLLLKRASGLWILPDMRDTKAPARSIRSLMLGQYKGSC